MTQDEWPSREPGISPDTGGRLHLFAAENNAVISYQLITRNDSYCCLKVRCQILHTGIKKGLIFQPQMYQNQYYPGSVSVPNDKERKQEGDDVLEWNGVGRWEGMI